MRLREWYAQREDGDQVTRRIEVMGDLAARHSASLEQKTLLDLGCGTGAATLHIAQRVRANTLLGVELSERAAAIARRRGIDVYAVDLNAEQIPCPDASIDVVVCGEVLEHLVDTDHMLDEIGRVLAPGGICVLSTPNLAAWYNRALLALGYQPMLSQVSFRHAPGRPSFAPGEGGDHLRMFSARALLEFVELHGFTVRETRGVSVRDLGHAEGHGVAQRTFFELDQLMARVPTLACDVVLAISR